MSGRRDLHAIRLSRMANPPTQAGQAKEADPPFKSPTHWMVLALVIQRPSWGYEINLRFQGRFGEFCSVNPSKVYDSLNKLDQLGFIEVLSSPQERRQKGQEGMRRYFRATATGARAYKRWALEMLKEDAQRAELLGKIATVGVLGLQAIRDVVDLFEQDCLARAQQLALPEGIDSGEPEAEVAALTDMLVLEQQRLAIEAELAWVAFARRQVDACQRRQEERQGRG